MTTKKNRTIDDGKLWIKDTIRSVGGYETVETLKACLKDVEDGIADGRYRDVHLKIVQDYDCMAFMGFRKATAEEQKAHKYEQAKQNRAQEDRDKEEFKRLKKKLGK